MMASVHTIGQAGQEPLAVVEAEAALLGAMMIQNGLVDRICEIVRAEDFWEPVHARIFAAIEREVSSGRSANPVLLRGYFADDPGIKELGGVGYLAQLTGSGAVLIGVNDFARQIADFAKRRRLRDSLQGVLAEIAVPSDDPVEGLVEQLDATLAEALQQTSKTKAVTLLQAFDQTLELIRKEADGEVPKGVEIAGLDDWNHLTGGMRAGEVTIIGARPGMGKTAVALAVATGAARNGHGTLLVSLEMRTEELVKRSIADLLWDYDERAPHFEHVKKGYFNEFDRRIIAGVRERIAAWPLILTDPSKLKIGRLAMSIRRFQRQMAAKDQRLELVVLDYLGLIKPDERAGRYEAIGEISRTIKEVAKECGVHIVMLAQLNRECERREDKRPQLSDLRDSGDIEQDADNIIFLFREQYYLEKCEPPPGDKKYEQWRIDMEAARDRLEIIAAKRRNGKTGKRLCWFFADRQAVRSSSFSRAQMRMSEDLDG